MGGSGHGRLCTQQWPTAGMQRGWRAVGGTLEGDLPGKCHHSSRGSCVLLTGLSPYVSQ